MNLQLKYHGLPSLGITGKKGSAGVSAGKIYFINQNNFEALFEFSDISITKYVYRILNKKFSNNEQVEFYLGGDENTISQTILNRQSYQYYPLSYSNTNRNTHNMRNFALIDKTSYFIIDDISGETPDEDNKNTNKSRIYLDQTYTSENDGKLYKYDDNGNLQEINYQIAGDVQGLQGEPGEKFYKQPTENNEQEAEEHTLEVLKPYVIVRDSYGNVIYTCNEEGNLSTELSEGDKQWTTYDRSYKQDDYENPDDFLIVKMPMKLRSIFKEGDIIFIKTDLLDKDKAPEEESSNDKDYNMLYISDDLVGAAYLKILNSLVEYVFVKYPYIYNNVYDVYHIDLRNVISSNCFRDEIYKKSLDIVGELPSDTYNKYQKFKDHNARSLESLITGDNSYQMTIIETPQTDVVNKDYYTETSLLNNDDVHQNLLALTNETTVGTNIIQVWYNHNLHDSLEDVDKLRTPDKFDDVEHKHNQGYFIDNQAFIINVKNNDLDALKIFVDDPYVRTDMLSNLYVKDVIYDKSLVYEYGYLPAIPEENISTSYKQIGTALKIFVNIKIPNSLIFNNTRNAKNYRVTYFIKYKNNKRPVENGDITNNKLSFEYYSEFIFMYGIESLNNGIRKYGKPILISVDSKQLREKKLMRIKNMINLNVTLNVKTLDTFDMLPEDLLLFTHEKITYETEKSYMKIEVNPDIEYAYLKSVEIYGIKNPGANKAGIYPSIGDGHSEYIDNTEIIKAKSKWTSSDLNQRVVEFTFDSNNKPIEGIYKYFYNDKKQNTFYRLVTDYVLNYRDYQDEKILVHHNKVDLRRHPKFNLKIETDGNTLETINSFSNGIYCNHFVTYLYLDIEDFDSKYWYTENMNQTNALLDVSLSLNNNITTNRGEIINRAFFKSFNKEQTNINFKITDITSCKNVAEQNEKVSNHPLFRKLMLYTYSDDDVTNRYDTGLQVFNMGNAKYTSLYNNCNFDFTIPNLTYEDKHLKLRIDLELSNPVLSNVFMQWEVSDYNIHYSDETYNASYKFDYLPLTIDMTNNSGSEIVPYNNVECYIQTNKEGNNTNYILYVSNNEIVEQLTDETGKLIPTHATFEFIDDIFARYSNDIRIFGNTSNMYFVFNGDKDIEKTICKSNTFNIAINPVEFIAGKNDVAINNIIGGGTKYTGSDAQIQLYAGLVEPDYEFNNYVDLNNYVLYKKYFQDNVKAITIESTGNVRLMVKYNADLFAPQSRFNNSVFYYNTEELETIRYNKNHPLYFSNISHRLVIRDDKLLKSMKAWNETYEKMTKYKTLTFTGNISKYSNGYMLLQIKASTVQYKTYYYYNVIGKYKTEYFNKIVYNINDHQFDDKGLYTLTDTQMKNNIIVDNNEMKDSLYVNVEQPVIPTMYQPLRNQYYRTLMFDIDWVYLDSTGATNRDDEYEKHLVLYPRIAFNTTYDTINVLMLKQPLTYEKKYYFYNDYQPQQSNEPDE